MPGATNSLKAKALAKRGKPVRGPNTGMRAQPAGVSHWWSGTWRDWANRIHQDIDEYGPGIREAVAAPFRPIPSWLTKGLVAIPNALIGAGVETVRAGQQQPHQDFIADLRHSLQPGAQLGQATALAQSAARGARRGFTSKELYSWTETVPHVLPFLAVNPRNDEAMANAKRDFQGLLGLVADFYTYEKLTPSPKAVWNTTVRMVRGTAEVTGQGVRLTDLADAVKRRTAGALERLPGGAEPAARLRGQAQVVDAAVARELNKARVDTANTERNIREALGPAMKDRELANKVGGVLTAGEELQPRFRQQLRGQVNDLWSAINRDIEQRLSAPRQAAAETAGRAIGRARKAEAGATRMVRGQRGTYMIGLPELSPGAREARIRWYQDETQRLGNLPPEQMARELEAYAAELKRKVGVNRPPLPGEGPKPPPPGPDLTGLQQRLAPTKAGKAPQRGVPLRQLSADELANELLEAARRVRGGTPTVAVGERAFLRDGRRVRVVEDAGNYFRVKDSGGKLIQIDKNLVFRRPPAKTAQGLLAARDLLQNPVVYRTPGEQVLGERPPPAAKAPPVRPPVPRATEPTPVTPAASGGRIGPPGYRYDPTHYQGGSPETHRIINAARQAGRLYREAPIAAVIRSADGKAAIYFDANGNSTPTSLSAAMRKFNAHDAINQAPPVKIPSTPPGRTLNEARAAFAAGVAPQPPPPPALTAPRPRPQGAPIVTDVGPAPVPPRAVPILRDTVASREMAARGAGVRAIDRFQPREKAYLPDGSEVRVLKDNGATVTIRRPSGLRETVPFERVTRAPTRPAIAAGPVTPTPTRPAALAAPGTKVTLPSGGEGRVLVDRGVDVLVETPDGARRVLPGNALRNEAGAPLRPAAIAPTRGSVETAARRFQETLTDIQRTMGERRQMHPARYEAAVMELVNALEPVVRQGLTEPAIKAGLVSPIDSMAFGGQYLPRVIPDVLRGQEGLLSHGELEANPALSRIFDPKTTILSQEGSPLQESVFRERTGGLQGTDSAVARAAYGGQVRSEMAERALAFRRIADTLQSIGIRGPEPPKPGQARLFTNAAGSVYSANPEGMTRYVDLPNDIAREAQRQGAHSIRPDRIPEIARQQVRDLPVTPRGWLTLPDNEGYGPLAGLALPPTEGTRRLLAFLPQLAPATLGYATRGERIRGAISNLNSNVPWNPRAGVSAFPTLFGLPDMREGMTTFNPAFGFKQFAQGELDTGANLGRTLPVGTKARAGLGAVLQQGDDFRRFLRNTYNADESFASQYSHTNPRIAALRAAGVEPNLGPFQKLTEAGRKAMTPWTSLADRTFRYGVFLDEEKRLLSRGTPADEASRQAGQTAASVVYPGDTPTFARTMPVLRSSLFPGAEAFGMRSAARAALQSPWVLLAPLLAAHAINTATLSPQDRAILEASGRNPNDTAYLGFGKGLYGYNTGRFNLARTPTLDFAGEGGGLTAGLASEVLGPAAPFAAAVAPSEKGYGMRLSPFSAGGAVENRDPAQQAVAALRGAAVGPAQPGVAALTQPFMSPRQPSPYGDTGGEMAKNVLLQTLTGIRPVADVVTTGKQALSAYQAQRADLQDQIKGRMKDLAAAGVPPDAASARAQAEFARQSAAVQQKIDTLSSALAGGAGETPLAAPPAPTTALDRLKAKALAKRRRQ